MGKEPPGNPAPPGGQRCSTRQMNLRRIERHCDYTGLNSFGPGANARNPVAKGRFDNGGLARQNLEFNLLQLFQDISHL